MGSEAKAEMKNADESVSTGGRRLGARMIAIDDLLPQEKKRDNREFLVVGWDPDAALVRENSGDRQPGLGIVDGGREDVVPLHLDLNLGRPERATLQSFTSDGFEQGDAPGTEKLASERGRAIAELQSGIDQPDAILGERGVHGDSEGIVLPLGGHRSTLPLDADEVKNGQVKA